MTIYWLLQVANKDAFLSIILIITTGELVNIPALLISLRRSGLLWDLPCGEIKGPEQSVGENHPTEKERKKEPLTFTSDSGGCHFFSILIHVVSKQESGQCFVQNECHIGLFVSVLTVADGKF